MVSTELLRSIYERSNPYQSEDSLRMQREAARHSMTREMLCKILYQSRLFEKIDPKDEATIGARNVLIDFLDECGFLDQTSIEEIADAMLRLPVFPDEAKLGVNKEK